MESTESNKVLNKFEDFELSKATLDGLKDGKFLQPTEIQMKTLQPALEGHDILVAAKTGSGKTLAFLIPVIELMRKTRFSHKNGTGIIVVSPTRELAIQIFKVLKVLMKNHSQTYGLVIGGNDKKGEIQKLAKGVNILIATPGRLLDHLQNTQEFVFKNLKCLVLDEADKILDVGFEEELKQILKILPQDRQTLLFSATLNDKTAAIAENAVKNDSIKIGIDDEQKEATVSGLKQGYLVVKSENRFLILYTFLKKNKKKKIMVFLSSCDAVKFYYELLNYIELPVLALHGKQKQNVRLRMFSQFSNATSGILLCTDVAARGLDIPRVDWIVQYDPPDEPKEYIHRVGRTARGINSVGNALLMIGPDETNFLKYLKKAKVPLEENEFSWSKVPNIRSHLESLVSKNYALNVSAKNAFRSFVRAYNAHSLKNTFDISSLDLVSVAKSFCLEHPPPVDLPEPSLKKRKHQ